MVSNPTSIRPSPMVTCFGTGLCHNSIHLRLGRVGFRPRSYPHSCRLSRVNRPISISKETVNNTPRRVSGEVFDGLSCEEYKSLMGEEEQKFLQLFDGMSVQGVKNMNEVADCLSKEEIKKLRVIIKGLSEEEMEKVRKFADDLTEEENKNFIEVLNVTSEAERRFFIEFMRSFFKKEEKLIIGVAVLFWKDLMSKNKLQDQIDVLRRICYTVRRFGFIKNVLLSIVVPQLLSGALAYAVMKQSPLVAAAFNQKHFYLFTLLLTGGLRIPTLKAFKDKFPIQKNGILNTILHVATAAVGVLLADVHIAKSNGIIMVAALISTLIMFILQICIACQLIVVKNKELSYFESISDSDSGVIRAIIASFIQIINPGPITAAIDTGFNYTIFLSPVVSNIGMILKGGFYNDDDCTAASANLFWGLYDLFISLIKAMAMLSGFLIISGKGLGMLSGLFIKAMSVLFGLIVS